MATISQYVSDLRALIKEGGRSEDVYTDSFLYSLLNGAMNTLIAQQATKINNLDPWGWYQFPMKLVKDKSHLVGCVTVGCDILRTEYKIPKAISSELQLLMEFRTFDYSPIDIVDESTYKIYQYDDIKSKTPQISIINDYGIIWNKPELKWILVNGIWQNILDWSTIPQCDNNGNYTQSVCFDAMTSDFKLPEKLKIAAYQMVLNNLLDRTLPIPKDITNDSNSEIKA